jgi:putative tricarboxylic transport membrane protein
MENKSTKKTFNYNYLSVTLIYIWAAAFLLWTPKIKDPASRMFPVGISIFAIILATILLLKTKYNWGKNQELNFSGTKTAMIMAAFLIIYVGVIEVVGYYFATPFYLYISMWVLGQKNKKLMLVISLLMSLGAYVFFGLLLDMQIPEGMLLPWLLG